MQTIDNGIHRTVGTDFLARLLNGYTASYCALCYAVLVNNESCIDGEGNTDNIETPGTPGVDEPASFLSNIIMYFSTGSVTGGHTGHSSK